MCFVVALRIFGRREGACGAPCLRSTQPDRSASPDAMFAAAVSKPSDDMVEMPPPQGFSVGGFCTNRAAELRDRPRTAIGGRWRWALPECVAKRGAGVRPG